MSAKWRAIQHRHRYTYSAVIFPPHFTQTLSQVPRDSPFFAELKHFTTLNSTYAQLEHAKKVASAFSDLISDPNADEKTVSSAVRYYLEILFLENSLPLHRTLASVLAKCKNCRELIEGCYRNLCEEYGGGKRFCVSRAALSLMSTPKLGYLIEVVEHCAVLVGLDVVSGLGRVIDETNESSRPSPLVMEQCQEALSCLYYLLQRFPGKFCDFCSGSVLGKAFVSVLDILKSDAFSRDCFVAAGVSFCAALQVCLSAEELGLFIMRVIFGYKGIRYCGIELDDVVRRIPYPGNLIDGISGLSPLSRLCLIRGILTAVSRNVLYARYVVSIDRLSGSAEDEDNGGCLVKTILYDGLLPELCSYAENPRDSHSNFHTLTVMQICLQQIKTVIQGVAGETTDDYDPITEEMGARILKIVWNNLEDPLSQTVKQVHLIFDLYLDILLSLKWAEGSETIKFLLRKIASDLLSLGPRCKGRYVPLASLTRRLGAKTILDMNQELLFETAKAYIDDDVCYASTTFLKCFLECLRDEYWSSDGIDGGYAKYRGHCLLPFLSGLACGIPKLRSNLNTYALPVLLEIDIDSIFSMLASIGIDCSSFVDTDIGHTDYILELEQQIAVFVSLLKVSRALALMEGDIDWFEGSLSVSSQGAVLDTCTSDLHCVVIIKGIEVKIQVKWIVLALTHIDESLRMDAAETLFLNPKTASLPSHLELSLMRAAVPLNMRSSSTAFLMKWNSLFRKFFARVRTALERQMKLKTWKPLASGDVNGVSEYTGAYKDIKHRAEYLFEFTKWLSCFLFFSCYPSAPYERKITAMELMLIMLNVWPLVKGHQDNFWSETNLNPYSQSFTSPNSTLLLVGSIVDSWDRLRENSFRILLNFPNPLPGVSSPDLVREAIIWAINLVSSPRVRESDAGALTLRLLFRKYVLELGWIVRPSCNVVSFSPKSDLVNGANLNCSSSSPVVSYVTSLVDWLLSSVEDAERNLSEACRNSFVHGVLLALRYTFEELDWNTNVVLGSITEMRHVLQRLLELVRRITSLALWVVSANALYLPEDVEDMEDMADDEEIVTEIRVENDPSESGPNIDVKVSELVETRRSEQIVMVGCWLAMKEVSLLLGTIIRKVPLPSSEENDGTKNIIADEYALSSEPVLDLKQLETIGNHFLEVLFKMKHNGAIDKTRAGFTALCNRLLCSNDPRLCRLTESWMEQLMERTIAKGQTVDDLLRRSAGIPAAFIAFFLSEPEGIPKRMLPRTLHWLIDFVKKSQADLGKANCSNLSSSDEAGTKIPVPGSNTEKEMSKFRDEGVVPIVHAFNVLRATFNDTNLATDTSGFSAEAMIVAILSFSSPYWEIRNSATLAYTALVRRMVGFLNIHKRESARRAITGLEFFHRYPTLHSFLFNELKVATEMLLDGSSEQLNSNMKSVVHPSLCPILILLSRLKPSPLSSETGDALDPFLFMPFIRRCSVQSNFRIRVLASSALTGLVSNEKLQVVIQNIASELPRERSHMMPPDSTNGISSSFNSIHGMLLQLNSLLDNNCRNLADSSKKDMILQELIQILGTRLWIGIPQNCPCPILNCCMLKVLDNMLSISRTCETSKSANVVWNLLWELSSACLDLKPSDGTSYFDPTLQELHKQAATSYFNCIFQTTKEAVEDDPPMRTNSTPSFGNNSCGVFGEDSGFTRFQERLIRSMSDALYEVRIAVLKWLLLFLKTVESSGNGGQDQIYFKPISKCLVSINLQETVLKLLGSERHHKCMHYLLQILYTWNLLGLQDDNTHTVEPSYVCNMDFDAIFHLWNKMVSIFKTARLAKMQQTLICCLGMCAKRISNLFITFISSEMEAKADQHFQTEPNKMFSDFYDSLSYFVVLIEQNSDASEPVNMRKAAAKSIIASGLLGHAEILGSLLSNNPIPERNLDSHFNTEEAVRSYTLKILDLWLTCIKLLEDEDVELRKKLALDVQKCFSSKILGNKSGSNQVEKVIELCFKHLSKIFGHWLGYVDYLCCWVLNAANNTNYYVSGGDLVRRVFDKEIDNHHEEKLLICQICCSHLEEFHVSQAKESSIKIEARNLLLKWRGRFSQELRTFARNHVGKKGMDDWIGGLGNHKDAFLPLYANLLAFYALSNCVLRLESENSAFILDEVSALGEEINPFLGNPLISNLFSMVVKCHERYIGRSGIDLIHNWRISDSTWVEFNPYFLLR